MSVVKKTRKELKGQYTEAVYRRLFLLLFFFLNFASYQLLASVITPDSTVTLMLLKAFIGFLTVVERQKWSSEGRGVPAEGFTDCLPPDACLLMEI